MTTTDTDNKQTTTNDQWSYKTMTPEVSAFLRSKKQSLDHLPVFMTGRSLKWNIGFVKVDGKRTRVTYMAPNSRKDVVSFVRAALKHSDIKVPKTGSKMADAFEVSVMRKYAKHLKAQKALAAGQALAENGNAWWAEGHNVPLTDEFNAAKTWLRSQDPKWSEAFNGVSDRRKKIISAAGAHIWEGNVDGQKTKTVKTRSGGKKTVKGENRPAKMVTKANMMKALNDANVPKAKTFTSRTKVSEVRETYQQAIDLGLITGVSA
tara:strand:+ start:251 stop:1039 length:789 start_codon:yes stop_codon:yes gene_type:complete